MPTDAVPFPQIDPASESARQSGETQDASDSAVLARTALLSDVMKANFKFVDSDQSGTLDRNELTSIIRSGDTGTLMKESASMLLDHFDDATQMASDEKRASSVIPGGIRLADGKFHQLFGDDVNNGGISLKDIGAINIVAAKSTAPFSRLRADEIGLAVIAGTVGGLGEGIGIAVALAPERNVKAMGLTISAISAVLLTQASEGLLNSGVQTLEADARQREEILKTWAPQTPVE